MKSLLTLLSIFCCVPAIAQDVDYVRDIQPLFAEKCSSCHGALRQEAGLRLDHGELIRRGGDSGSVLEVEENEPSLLLERVTASESLRMPPEGEGEPLSKAQVNLLEAWIAGGAPSPANETIPPPPDQHWAWQVPVQVEPPPGPDSLWSENPIDAFISYEHRLDGVRPAHLADQSTRIRRLYFDLIGLPPTPAEQHTFLVDSSPDAWSKVVEDLLESPAYGERWARHWMDVWRYSDWDGYKDAVRGSQRHIWRWRDWIVESLNDDKGYDQMIVEMLAGDEVAPENPQTLRATGFLARNFHNSNRNIWLDATVEHTAKAFLGLTLNCARCHDHKYDPIPQREYYAFRAIFEAHHVRTERVRGQADIVQDGLVRVFDAEPKAKTYVFEGGNEKRPDEENPVAPATPQVLNVALEVTPVQLPAVAVFPALRSFIEQEDLANAERKLHTARSALAKLEPTSAESKPDLEIAQQALEAAESDLMALRARWQADKACYNHSCDEPQRASLARLAVEAEHRSQLENATLDRLKKQRAVTLAEEALQPSDASGPPADKQDKQSKTADKDGKERKAALETARKEFKEAEKSLAKAKEKPAQEAKYTPVGKSYPAVSTGRRLALARWITRPDNPLTARVAVNYIWMHHFGEPLVDNVFDFGLRSPEPRHRALLDWLAVELIRHDWSMKHLHRLITTSRCYQLASHCDDSRLVADNRRIDPDNHLLWRANVRRLDAEVIRDSLLHVGGKLDHTMGGPDINFLDGEKVLRRSLYFRHAYEKQMTMLVLFDAAGPTECYRRTESIIPQQALALSNSPLSYDQARILAKRLWPASDDRADGDVEAIEKAFEMLLGRRCTNAERRLCTEFLETQTELLSNGTLTELPGGSPGQTAASSRPIQRARESLLHTLMNHNDFVTVR